MCVCAGKTVAGSRMLGLQLRCWQDAGGAKPTPAPVVASPAHDTHLLTCCCSPPLLSYTNTTNPQTNNNNRYNADLERVVRQRVRRGRHFPIMKVIPPGLDFSNLKISPPPDPLAALNGSTGR